MGAIQNSINQISGTLMGAAVAGKHLANQKEATELAKEVQKGELQKQLKQDLQDFDKADINLAKNTDVIVDKEIAEKGFEKAEVDPDKILANKEIEAGKAWQEAQDEAVRREVLKEEDPSFTNRMAWGKANKRMQMADKAWQEAQDAITARESLKFDLDQATQQINNTFTKLNQLGGIK